MKYENVQTIWNILDIEKVNLRFIIIFNIFYIIYYFIIKSGNVSLAVFLSVCSPLLFHNNINIAISDIKKLSVRSPSKSFDQDNSSSNLNISKTEDYQCVKAFIM